MSRALPERIQPLRLAEHGASLSGSVSTERMPRLSGMLHGEAGEARVTLHFGRDDGGQAQVSGRIDARLAVVCQRCLEPMEIAVEREVNLALVRDDAQAAALDAAYDPLLIGDEPIALSGLIEDELILAMPNFSRHPPGACEMPPGADAEEEVEDSHTAGESGEDNPFSALESLKPRKQP